VKRTSVVVVGGGITGLSAAYTLARKSIDFLLIEKEQRLGGTIRTEREAGFLLDTGPDAFLAQKPDGVALCRELGIEKRLIPTNPAERTVYVLHGGRLHPLPEGMVLTVPTRILPLASSSLFSLAGKARMALDLLIPARQVPDESIASFVRRRLGDEALERLAEPLLAGIHSGDPERLSMSFLFPRFVALEKKYGSLIRGMRKAAPRRDPKKKGGKASSIFLTLEGGLGELVDAIAGRLPADSLLKGEGVRALRRDGERYCLQLDSGEEVSASACVMAVPLRAAERLVENVSSDLADLLVGIPTVSTAVVFLGFPREQVRHPLNGYGLVVPRTEGRRILAATFVSSKFANRAPSSHVLLRAFLGGTRDPDVLGLSDAALIDLAVRELGEILGSLGEPSFSRVCRWRHGTPQVEVGHADLLAAIETRLQEMPGLGLAGNGVRGVGIPDCIADGRRSAEAAVAFLERGAATLRPSMGA
jgi:oxygen-dependent protoporphyrinogen oxidase